MTSDRIARDYLAQARGRRVALDALLASRVYPAVVRESQEIVELVLEDARAGLLRRRGGRDSGIRPVRRARRASGDGGA